MCLILVCHLFSKKKIIKDLTLSIGKENTVLRAKVPKENVSVIPNAVDTAHFTPNPIKRPTDVQSMFSSI